MRHTFIHLRHRVDVVVVPLGSTWIGTFTAVEAMGRKAGPRGASPAEALNLACNTARSLVESQDHVVVQK